MKLDLDHYAVLAEIRRDAIGKQVRLRDGSLRWIAASLAWAFAVGFILPMLLP